MLPTVRLRSDAVARLRDRFGCSTDTALAQRIGITQAVLSRVTTGRASPGPTFIARLILAAPDMSFDDMFEVVADPDRAT